MVGGRWWSDFGDIFGGVFLLVGFGNFVGEDKEMVVKKFYVCGGEGNEFFWVGSFDVDDCFYF